MPALLSLTVERLDGSSERHPVLPVDMVAFERQFSIGWGKASQDMHFEHLYWLAWHCEQRKAMVKPFDDWVEEILNVTSEDDVSPLPKRSQQPSD
jgi:hypothetical protein